MESITDMRRVNEQRGILLRQLILLLAFLFVVFYCWPNWFGGFGKSPSWSVVFVTPLPEPPKPQAWIYPDTGGERQFGPVIAIVPSGFTKQGGANVYGNMIMQSSIEKPAMPRFVPGTEFAFGIWPAQVQTTFEKPIEFRINLNAAQYQDGEVNRLSLMMYDSASCTWSPVTSQFRPELYQVVASVAAFTPVPNNFPDWGGRTFFALFLLDSSAQPQKTTTLRSANIRSGPSFTYPIVRTTLANQALTVVGRSDNGLWLQLEDGNWIYSRLVQNVPTTLPVSESP